MHRFLSTGTARERVYDYYRAVMQYRIVSLERSYRRSFLALRNLSSATMQQFSDNNSILSLSEDNRSLHYDTVDVKTLTVAEGIEPRSNAPSYYQLELLAAPYLQQTIKINHFYAETRITVD